MRKECPDSDAKVGGKAPEGCRRSSETDAGLDQQRGRYQQATGYLGHFQGHANGKLLKENGKNERVEGPADKRLYGVNLANRFNRLGLAAPMGDRTRRETGAENNSRLHGWIYYQIIRARLSRLISSLRALRISTTSERACKQALAHL